MGEVTGVFVDYGACGVALPDARSDDPPEDRVPCPECGSTRRHVRMYIEDSITLTSMLGVKQKRPGVTKPLLDMKVGDSMSADGTIAQIDQVIDRTVEPAVYRKRVVKADGTVIRDVSHPLSEHVGRGSAKPKKTP